ncbi:pentatricopeptide repeat-containing protein At2g36980, mitochondrial [Argentina anserina]|uniref:pentatricopeptide repeat-containing protein At2g36980, mitochondrial n=1 Tax=Argentina anserina TaxID=57926 RepID=UPI002176428F|nr:pentatricopeptide repeat-containing protein At2g36980, mitochondrial [Potentilla anserina]
MKCTQTLIKTTSQIAAFARSGHIKHARQLFDEMPHRDSIAWNAMLTAYTHLGFHHEALSLLRRMRISGTSPDHFTFTATLSACAGASELKCGTKLHGLVTVLGYRSYLPVNNALIDMYGKCLAPCGASRVFEEMRLRNEVSWCSLLFAYTNSGKSDAARGVFNLMPRRVEVAWNVMIVGHARNGEVELCLGLLKEMKESLCWPDQWTFSAVMSACADALEFWCGCILHALIIKSGWSSFVEVKNSVLSFYADLGCLENAVKVFESGGTLTQVSWNAMIDAYMKLGSTHEALRVFQLCPERNIVSWTSMISGYARNGNGEEAAMFFVHMLRTGLQPDGCSFAAVLHACSNLALLGCGEMFHGRIIHCGFHAYAFIGNGLVNMYAKSGDLKGSICAFHDILHKDLVSWNSMLFAFGLHGKAIQSLQVFEQMVVNGVKPDNVTFIGLLMACSHSGLIGESRALFETMQTIYGLSPDKDHVACMVDILGRGGYLAEAKELADKFSSVYSAKISSGEALLVACSAHEELGFGKYLGDTLKMAAPHNETSYVLLSNLYCASGQWKEAEMVRKRMADQGVKKMPGCSWIEVRNKVMCFVAGKNSKPFMDEVYSILQYINFEMRNPSFVDTNS